MALRSVCVDCRGTFQRFVPVYPYSGSVHGFYMSLAWSMDGGHVGGMGGRGGGVSQAPRNRRTGRRYQWL